jgi:2-polyprenyl-6-methoxyphenol hydroxylase-like FAD-dependent oxidoreductase
MSSSSGVAGAEPGGAGASDDKAQQRDRPAPGGDGRSVEFVDAIVCGGGPAGLLAAVMVAQTFPGRKVGVFDRLSPPSSPDDGAVWDDVAKFYLIGIGGRGQAALKRFGVWDEVLKRSVPVLGRKGAYDRKEGGKRARATRRNVFSEPGPIFFQIGNPTRRKG